MNCSFSFPFNRRLIWGVFVGLLTTFPLLAQQSVVTITSLGNDEYRFGTTNLASEDLVFYRFADGFEISAVCTSNNPDAPVTRKFRNGQIKVSAYIAKKNGPLGLATNDGPVVSCAACPLPYAGLLPNEYVRLRGTSWSPFVDPANPTPMTDNKTNPTFVTPNIPWFYLPVTIKAPSVNGYINITVPAGMTIRGAVVKQSWTQININANPTAVAGGDPDVNSFWYPSQNSFRINLNGSSVTEFNVYLVVSSSTQLGEQSAFVAQAFNNLGAAAGNPSSIKLITRQKPRDPNCLTSFDRIVCERELDAPPLTYRVDFQNIGEANAENIEVRVTVDRRVFDATNYNGDILSSSHPVTFQAINEGELLFTFTDIQLPGLNQVPQTAPERAQGYVEFGLEPIPCVKQDGGGDFFITNAAVTFLAPSINFSETLQTNSSTQAFGPCNPDQECATDRNALTALNVISEPRCYPTLFQDVLNVEVPAQPTPEKMNVVLMNLNGQTIEKRLVQTVAGDATYLRLNTSELNNGIYLVRLVQGDQISTFKVVKQ